MIFNACVVGYRVYLERKHGSEVRLYVTNIIDRDAGTYECRGRIQGNEVSATSQLYIFSEYKI